MEEAPQNQIDILEKGILLGAEYIFDNSKDAGERLAGLERSIVKLELYLKLLPNKDEIEISLRDLAKIEERDLFLAKMVEVLKPLIDFKKLNPLAFEQASRDFFVGDIESIRLNDILSYEIDDNEVHLHLSPAKELIKTEGISIFKKMITQGLITLAKIVSANENITEINGISWIAAKNPRILEVLGFTVVHGKIPNEVGPSGDTRPVSFAFISRQDFLNKYLSD